MFVRLTAPRLHPDPKSAPCVGYSAPSPRSAAAAAKARRIALQHLSEKNLPGLSAAVGIHGDIAWAEGFGFADLSTRAPVTPDCRFRIGTASVALTSAAVGLLLEAGRLRLDDEIQTYVPEFPRKQWPVTLRELMAHTAGLDSDGGDEALLAAKHCERPVEALRYFAGEPLLFKPGSERRESSYGWIVVSAAIEAAANQPFPTFMRRRIFEPLGMRNTVPDPATVSAPAEADDDFPLFNLIRELIFDPRTRRAPDAHQAKPSPERATSYFPRFIENPGYGLHLMRPVDYSCYAGSSGFLSTPSDLVRFAMAINGGALLKRATVDLLQTSQQLSTGEKTRYGLGWDLEPVVVRGKRMRAIGHNGDILGGMAASLLILPDYGIVVAVTSNISHADTLSLAAKIAEIFVGEEDAPAHH
jgi:CubicO group peptidase (beta-lactamase class C family)